MKNQIILKSLLAALLLFAAVRLALFLVYRDYFANTQLITALLQGVRFDMRLLVMAWLPFLLILLLPFGKLNHLTIRRFCVWAMAIMLTLLFGVAVADIAYFGEVQRHLGSELLNIGGDMTFIVQTAFGTRLGYTTAGLATLIAMLFLWNKYLISNMQIVSGSLKQRAFMSVAYLLLLVLMARGLVLSGKPLNTIDAFQGNGQPQANLTLNGVWVAVQAARDRQHIQPLTYLDSNTYQKLNQENAFRYQSNKSPTGKNIVFILLESWSYRYIDGLAGGKYGVTPYIDTLIQKSQVWDNFYAAGQRSIIGIQAALTSVPALPDRQPLGFGLEMNNMSRIAGLAGEHGYRTLMVQSSKRRSFHMDGIAQALGFQEYYGQEDIPIIRDYPQKTPPFGWDYDTLQFFGQQISKQPEKPFFAFLFTGSTHEPFANGGTEFMRYPHDEKNENGFLNSLAYSDWALREFMAYAEKQNWYHNTIFVFTADHILNNAGAPTDVRQRFHIPLIVFDPNQTTAQRHQRLASQYDLLPTFADILGINAPVFTFGNSLFNEEKNTPLMLNQGSSTAMIAPNGETAEFQGTQMISGSLKDENVQKLQWRMQKADELLRQNQWAK